jgi:hypothetical protein
VFLFGLTYAFSRKIHAPANPWGAGATTLEWTCRRHRPSTNVEDQSDRSSLSTWLTRILVNETDSVEGRRKDGLRNALSEAWCCVTHPVLRAGLASGRAYWLGSQQPVCVPRPVSAMPASMACMNTSVPLANSGTALNHLCQGSAITG